MKPTEIQASFAALLDTFDPITGQPTDGDLTRLNLACLSALVPIPFDREKGKHNLMGLLLADADYEQYMKLNSLLIFVRPSTTRQSQKTLF